MTDIFVVPSPLLQSPSVVYEPHQIRVVKYGDHCRAMSELERRVDTAYTQRNNAAVALVRMALLLGWPAGRGLDDKTDNAPEWRHVVYLDLPNGEQVSYHMAPADVPLLDGLPEYAGKWDGKFTGTTAWAGMVPAADAGWRALYDEPNLNACAICSQGAEACTATGCGFMEAGNGEPGTPSEGVLDLTPAEEAAAGVTRTAEGVTVGGLTFGPDSRITHGVPPATEQQVQTLASAAYGWPPSCARLDCPAPHEPDSPYCKEHRYG